MSTIFWFVEGTSITSDYQWLITREVGSYELVRLENIPTFTPIFFPRRCVFGEKSLLPKTTRTLFSKKRRRRARPWGKTHPDSMVILYNDSMEDKTEHDALKVFLSIIGIHLKNDKKSNLNAWIFVKTEIIDFYSMTNKTWYQLLQLHFLMVKYRILFIYHHSNHWFCHWWIRLRYPWFFFLVVLRGGSDVMEWSFRPKCDIISWWNAESSSVILVYHKEVTFSLTYQYQMWLMVRAAALLIVFNWCVVSSLFSLIGVSVIQYEVEFVLFHVVR